jgi:hypothetical protein
MPSKRGSPVGRGARPLTIRIPDDLDGPHAPIIADMLTYGLMCEWFAVDSYVNGHEIIGIDNLLSARRGISTDVSLELKDGSA